jgi:sRNA-binding carbon storage regulator CsrA
MGLIQFPFSWRSNLLVLSRKPGEKVGLGNDTTLPVGEVRGKRVRIALD